MKNALKLLIVDDSKVMREAITDMFADDPGIDIVGEAADGIEALKAAENCGPDVITMDVAMPVMDGITTLKHIMIKNPHPVVMLSSLTLEGAKVAFDALRYGAVDFISKPSSLNDANLNEQQAEIRSKIEYAARVEVNAVKYIRNRHEVTVCEPELNGGHCENIVALGAAEGGYGALLKIIPQLSADNSTAYLVSLYAAPAHMEAFASYLNNYSAVHVKCAVHDEVISPGVCYLSAGTDYVSVHKRDETYSLHVSPAPFASRKGSVDILMFSAADAMGANCTGIILSGLGSDGAEGLKEVLRMGGTVIVQDPKTALCKEMAKSALNKCEPDRVVSDMKIASTVNRLLSNKSGNNYRVTPNVATLG